MPTNEQDDTSFISLCIELDKSIMMLHQHVAKLPGLKRQKKEAWSVLKRMRLHAENCAAQITEFERVLAA